MKSEVEQFKGRWGLLVFIPAIVCAVVAICVLPRLGMGSVAGLVLVVVLVLLPAVAAYFFLRRIVAHFEADVGARDGDARIAFVNAVSHAIRTPLSGIMGGAGLLEQVCRGAEQARYIGLLVSAGNGLMEKVNNLQERALLDEGRLELDEEAFNLRSVLNDVLAALKTRAAEKGIVLAADYPGFTADCLIGDARRMYRVLFNILDNAIKFSEKGCVKIRLRVDAPSGGVCALHATIEDTGPGIDPALQAVLFGGAGPGGAAQITGSGIGLGVASGIIGCMGGRLWVTSEPGVGSIFHVEVGLRAVQKGEAEKPVGAMANMETMPRVLLAEDNPVNREMAVIILQKGGCMVDTAEDGLAALEMIKERRYDIAFIDLHMPGMECGDLLRGIRGHEAAAGGVQRLPVVVLTANASTGERRECKEAGADCLMDKPISRQKIENVLGLFLKPGSEKVEVPAIAPEQPAAPAVGGLKFGGMLWMAADTEAERLRIIDSYLKDLPIRCSQMQSALKRSDWSEVRVAAHQIAGACQMIGVVQVSCLAVEVEDAILAGVGSGVVPLASRLHEEVSLLISQMQNYKLTALKFSAG